MDKGAQEKKTRILISRSGDMSLDERRDSEKQVWLVNQYLYEYQGQLFSKHNFW